MFQCIGEGLHKWASVRTVLIVERRTATHRRLVWIWLIFWSYTTDTDTLSISSNAVKPLAKIVSLARLESSPQSDITYVCYPKGTIAIWVQVKLWTFWRMRGNAPHVGFAICRSWSMQSTPRCFVIWDSVTHRLSAAGAGRKRTGRGEYASSCRHVSSVFFSWSSSEYML